MSSLFALLMLAAAPAAPAADAPPPRPQAVAVGTARARILSPVRVRLSDGGTAAATMGLEQGELATHRKARRDGAQIIDCY